MGSQISYLFFLKSYKQKICSSYDGILIPIGSFFFWKEIPKIFEKNCYSLEESFKGKF